MVGFGRLFFGRLLWPAFSVVTSSLIRDPWLLCAPTCLLPAPAVCLCPSVPAVARCPCPFSSVCSLLSPFLHHATSPTQLTNARDDKKELNAMPIIGRAASAAPRRREWRAVALVCQLGALHHAERHAPSTRCRQPAQRRPEGLRCSRSSPHRARSSSRLGPPPQPPPPPPPPRACSSLLVRRRTEKHQGSRLGNEGSLCGSSERFV